MVKNLPAISRDTRETDMIPEAGRFPARGNGTLLQYSCLENPMDRGAWKSIVLGVARVRQDLADKPPQP